MTAPLVSIVLPAYNAAGFLPRAIDSVLQQSCRDYELIVMDNASTDATHAVMGGYTDARIRYVGNASNIGMVNNINKGLDLATGRLAVVLCADDHWDAAFLARSIDTQRSRPGLTFTNSIVIRSGQPETYRNVHRGRANVPAWRLVRHLHGIPLSSLMFPLSRPGTRFDARLPFNCDLEFVLRSMIQGRQPLTMIEWPGVYVALHAANETLRYDIRLENIKLLGIVSGYVSNPLLQLFVAARRGRLRLG